MNTLFKTFLSMSFSGACLILLLLLGKRLWRNKISRQWQYYIWLVVVLRLLCPFGAEISVGSRPIQSIRQTVVRAVSAVQAEGYTEQAGLSEVQVEDYMAQTEVPAVQTETSTAQVETSAAQTGKADRGSEKLTKAVDEKRRNEEGLENDRETLAVHHRFAAFLAEYGGLPALV